MAASPDIVSSVANAVGAVFNTISSFVGAGAQRYGLAKGIDANNIAASNAKAVAAYTGVANMQRIILYLLIALALIIVVVKLKQS